MVYLVHPLQCNVTSAFTMVTILDKLFYCISWYLNCMMYIVQCFMLVADRLCTYVQKKPTRKPLKKNHAHKNILIVDKDKVTDHTSCYLKKFIQKSKSFKYSIPATSTHVTMKSLTTFFQPRSTKSFTTCKYQAKIHNNIYLHETYRGEIYTIMT